MDWLDEQLNKVQTKNLSLKRTLRLYTVLGIGLVLFAQRVTGNICESWERLILSGKSVATLSQDSLFLYEVITFIHAYSFILYMILAIVAITQLFYQKKIAQPIKILQEQIKQVTMGQLDTPCYYQSGDEFEAVCSGFEKMRGQLVTSQEAILALHQKQKQLNAIFSHDLRTPLTVVQGNIQMIQTFQPSGQMDPEQLGQRLLKIESNISRLIVYVDTMRELQSFDELAIGKARWSLSEVEKAMEELGIIVSKELVFTQNTQTSQKLLLDLEVFKQVLGNLLANAQRFAKQTVTVSLELADGFLMLFVQDDGPGFQGDELFQAIQPYYSGDKHQHFGLGLTICQTLTQKHGGDLQLANSLSGGAIISASFAIHSEK